MKDRARRLARTTLRLLLVVCASVLLLELGLRGVGCRYRAKFWDAHAQPAEAGDVTLLCLGESTTAGLWLPPEQSYPKQLQGLLRRHYATEHIRVFVPPHLGQNTSQMVDRIDRYLDAARPAVVIVMAGVNNRWSLAESNIGKFMPGADWRTHLFRLRSFSDDLKVVRLLRLIAQDSGDRLRAMRTDLEGKPRFTKWPPENDPLVQSMLQSIGPEPFLRLWRSDVGEMIRQAQASGAAVILMTYPNYDTPPLAEFEAMAERWSIPLVKNRASFDRLIEEGRTEEFLFEDGRHPNAAGYAIVAREAFGAVVATGEIQRRLGVPDGADGPAASDP